MLIIYKNKVSALIKLMQEYAFPQSDFSYVIIFLGFKKKEICYVHIVSILDYCGI